MDDVRTFRVGKISKPDVLLWMEEVRRLAEAEDEELLKTVGLIKEVERKMEASARMRAA